MLLHRPFDMAATTVNGTEGDTLVALPADGRASAQERCRWRASTEDPASLHQLRIGIKRLRYALESFFVDDKPGGC
jgi:CHAD domain-containing protein